MCLSPVSLTRTIAGRKYTLHVPDGKCNECKKHLQNEYVIKAMEEASKSDTGMWFFTLTYNEENVPTIFDIDGEMDENTEDILKHKTLDRSDIKKWKDRVRRSYAYRNDGKRLDFSYCICGEYGPRTHRPHYHGLFFGLSLEEVQLFKNDWEKHNGYTNFKYIPKISLKDIENVSKYVSKYVCKIDALEDENVKNGKVQKPRKITSKGYGKPSPEKLVNMRRYYLAKDILDIPNINDLSGISKRQLDTLVREIIKRRKYRINGKDYKLPTYLRKEIFYYRDYEGVYKSSQLQDLVTYTLQRDVQKDFARELEDVANREQMPESYEAMLRASQIVCASRKAQRMDISEGLYSSNLRAYQKSKF